MCSQFPWSWSYSFYGKSVIFRKCLSCLSGADNEAESDIFVGKKGCFSEPKKMPQWGGVERCPACDKSVYPTDRVFCRA